MRLHLSYAKSQASLTRSQRSAARVRAATFCIEGQHLTVQQLAERAGCTVRQMHGRLHTARNGCAVVTLGRLGVRS